MACWVDHYPCRSYGGFRVGGIAWAFYHPPELNGFSNCPSKLLTYRIQRCSLATVKLGSVCIRILNARAVLNVYSKLREKLRELLIGWKPDPLVLKKNCSLAESVHIMHCTVSFIFLVRRGRKKKKKDTQKSVY